MAERVGFEPTVRCRITGFQDQRLKPLGHLSGKNTNSIAGSPFLVKQRVQCYNESLLKVYYILGANAMKVAFFDSGLGGLSVLHHAMQVLHGGTFLFYADEDHVPYGVKTREEVREYVREAMDFLVGQGAEAVVIACNTATSVAAKEMRTRYTIPIIGMEPAAKLALDLDDTRRVLVAATPITVHGEKMQHLLGRVDKSHLVDLLALPKLVTFAERGEFVSPEVMDYLKKEFSSFDFSKYSALVLGCTHFNYFKDTMRNLLPPSVRILDGNEGTVRELRRRLKEQGAEEERGEAHVTYYYSGREVVDPEELSRLKGALRRLSEVYSIS